MRDFEKPIDEMNLDEALRAYEHAMRNDVARPEITGPGPLSEDAYLNVRQRLYRRISQLESVAA